MIYSPLHNLVDKIYNNLIINKKILLLTVYKTYLNVDNEMAKYFKQMLSTYPPNIILIIFLFNF